MVLLSSATSNFRKGGLTTRGGGNTEELLNTNIDTPPTQTNQKGHWWSRAMNFVQEHPEGIGKAIGATTAAAAGIGDTVMGFLGKKTNMAKGLRDMKKGIRDYVDKDEQTGFGKFVKGFTMTSPEKEEKKESNGHVPTGYDRIKPYYISPSINRRPHMFSQEVANEWRRHNQHIGEISTNSKEQNQKKVKKIWKKWKKWRKQHPKKQSKAKTNQKKK